MKTHFRFSLINFLFICFIKFVFSQVFPVNLHVDNGDRDQMINIVFLSEGYKQNEMDKFRLDVEKTSIDFFNWSPFLEYYSHFNIYSIEVPSNESGTDHPRTAVDCPLDSPIFFSDTYFNSTFDYTGIHRLLVIQNLSKVYSVLQDNVPDWDG
jgi:hypothetical protein